MVATGSLIRIPHRSPYRLRRRSFLRAPGQSCAMDPRACSSSATRRPLGKRDRLDFLTKDAKLLTAAAP